jgi:hypothetical protein
MKNKGNFYAVNLIIAAILSLILGGAARAQSVNPSSPTALGAGEFTGKGPSRETNYYFNFTGGPGEAVINLEIKAKQYSTFARLEVLDAGLTTLATHNMNAATSTGAAQAQKKITLGEKQTVLLKLTLDANLAEYKITLAGAIEIASGSNENVQNKKTAATDGGESKISKAGFGKYKPGKLADLPKNGTLVVEMKDGSKQVINLKNVESVTFNP